MQVARHASRVVRPAVLPDQPDVRGASLGGRVGPPLQPKLDSPEVHGPLDDVGVVVEAEAAPIDRFSKRLRVGRAKQGVYQLRVLGFVVWVAKEREIEESTYKWAGRALIDSLSGVGFEGIPWKRVESDGYFFCASGEPEEASARSSDGRGMEKVHYAIDNKTCSQFTIRERSTQNHTHP